MTTVKTIVSDWLKANGYDGLACPKAECGCEIRDLFPCDCSPDTCQPAYRIANPTGESDWIMCTNKQASPE